MATKTDWRQHVKEEDAVRVFEALADPSWDFRTIGGIARATGLPRDRIREILERYSDLVRKSLVADEKGQELFTFAHRGATAGELMRTFKTALAKGAVVTARRRR